MLRIRLQRRGKKNYATYRVVIAEQRAPIQGKFLADVGFYNPHTDTFKVDSETVHTWLAQGVQPTPTVHNLMVTHGLLKAEKVRSWRAKQKEAETKTPEAKPAEQTGK